MGLKPGMRTVYLCSSVRADYVSFAAECLDPALFRVRELYYLTDTEYRKSARSTGIRRCWFRFQLYVLYPIMALSRALFAEAGAIFIVTSNTFYMPLLISFVSAIRGNKTIHLLYDLFPDALVVAGKVKRRSLAASFLGHLTRWTQRRCDGTVYLGEFLAQHAEACWGRPRVKACIDISADVSLYQREEPKAHWPLVFHYGGQLGHMHCAPTLVAALEKACAEPALKEAARFNFRVSGAWSRLVEETFHDSPVEVGPAVPSDQWRQLIEDFDVGLVTLTPGGATVCLPSKTYGMMAGGLAILAICPKWSDLGKLILDNEVGWVISNSPYDSAPTFPGNDYFGKMCAERADREVAEEFNDCIKHILANPDELLRRRRNAFRLMRSKFSKESLGKDWCNVLSRL